MQAGGTRVRRGRCEGGARVVRGRHKGGTRAVRGRYDLTCTAIQPGRRSAARPRSPCPRTLQATAALPRPRPPVRCPSLPGPCEEEVTYGQWEIVGCGVDPDRDRGGGCFWTVIVSHRQPFLNRLGLGEGGGGVVGGQAACKDILLTSPPGDVRPLVITPNTASAVARSLIVTVQRFFSFSRPRKSTWVVNQP